MGLIAVHDGLSQLVTAAKADVRVEARVARGQPADEVATAAATGQIALLVTVLKDRREWFDARRGWVSNHALSHASVMYGRPVPVSVAARLLTQPTKADFNRRMYESQAYTTADAHGGGMGVWRCAVVSPVLWP
jgi:hypothetical protein